MLSGYKALDFTDEKGALCGKILGDLGVEVIKVEKPGGDDSRRIGPFYHDTSGPETSLHWFAFNGSKRGITLDLDNSEGRERFKNLCKTADFIIESFTPGYMDERDIGYTCLSALNPRLIMTSITPFGQTGPYRNRAGSDLTISAMSGLMSICGDVDRAPLRMCFDQSYYMASGQAAAGTLVALQDRYASGEGQHVDVSIFDVAVRTNYREPFMWEWLKKTSSRMGSLFGRGGAGRKQLWPCKDGCAVWMFSLEDPRPARAWVTWMKEEGKAGDWGNIAWDTVSFRTWNPDQLDALERSIGEFIATHTVAELEGASMKRGLHLSPLNRIDQVAKDEQLTARRFWKEVSHPELEISLTYPRFTYVSSEGTNEIRFRAPRIGEHNQEINAEFATSAKAVPPGKQSGTPSSSQTGAAIDAGRALAGVKVLDFTWAGAGPYATRFLGDFGATVMKVESRKRPDNSRVSPPFKDNIQHPDRSIIYLHTNTSKLGITLNLRHPKGIEIARRLAALADVVVENFSPGTMDRLGLGYEDLKKIRPDIIMASSSIYGQSGPKSGLAGFGNTGYGVSGHFELTGWPDREPSWPGIAYADAAQPLFTVTAILSALDYRRRTGNGQHIDTTQAEIMAQFISPAILDYFTNGRVQIRSGNRSSYACPHGAFPCKGNDQWCALAVFNEMDWKSLCEVMGNPDWSKDQRFSTLNLRKAHEDELEERISEWTSHFERNELADLLVNAGVTCGPVQDGSDIVDRDPQLRERKSFVKLVHPVLGECNHPTSPVKLSKSPARVKTSPCLGEHNDYIYKELLGMSDKEYTELLGEGVFE